jgi:hypothetical protein
VVTTTTADVGTGGEAGVEAGHGGRESIGGGGGARWARWGGRVLTEVVWDWRGGGGRLQRWRSRAEGGGQWSTVSSYSPCSTGVKRGGETHRRMDGRGRSMKLTEACRSTVVAAPNAVALATLGWSRGRGALLLGWGAPRGRS